MSYQHISSDKLFINHVRMLNKDISTLLRVNDGYLYYLSCHSKWPPLSPFKHIFSYNFGTKCHINFILDAYSSFITSR